MTYVMQFTLLVMVIASWSNPAESVNFKSLKAPLRRQQKALGNVTSAVVVPTRIVCAAICLQASPTCTVANFIAVAGGIRCEIVDSISNIVADVSSDVYFDVVAYHIWKGYTLWQGKWYLGTTTVMNYATALQYCLDRKGTIFIPRTTAENTFVVDLMLAGGIWWMWYPIEDLATEGSIVFSDGTPVLQSDPVPWSCGYGCNNAQSNDCSQIDSNGKVTMYWCGYVDAGVMCLSQLL